MLASRSKKKIYKKNQNNGMVFRSEAEDLKYYSLGDQYGQWTSCLSFFAFVSKLKFMLTCVAFYVTTIIFPI